MGNFIGKKSPITEKISLPIFKKKEYIILYLEDVEIQVELMRYILDKYIKKNIRIIWKKRSEDIINYMKKNHVDLILVDRQIDDNETCGDELIKEIVNKKLFDIHKIIIISGIDKKMDTDELVYILKPMQINVVLEAINDALDKI